MWPGPELILGTTATIVKFTHILIHLCRYNKIPEAMLKNRNVFCRILKAKSTITVPTSVRRLLQPHKIGKGKLAQGCWASLFYLVLIPFRSVEPADINTF